jgi:hypothetical protein
VLRALWLCCVVVTIDMLVLDVVVPFNCSSMLANYQRRRFVLTDGYTSAGYSGRMPMAELADAIVQVGQRCSVADWVVGISVASCCYEF